MRHGGAFHYEAGPADARFHELIQQFELYHVSLAHPVTGEVQRLSPEGERILSSRQGITSELTERGRVAFLLWLEPSTCLFCSMVRLKDDVWAERYGLDGIGTGGAELVVNCLVDLFKQRAAKTVGLAIVVDEFAVLYPDFHWDDFVVGDTHSPPEWPMLLGFSKSFAKLNEIPNHLYVLETADNYVLFSRIAASVS